LNPRRRRPDRIPVLVHVLDRRLRGTATDIDGVSVLIDVLHPRGRWANRIAVLVDILDRRRRASPAGTLPIATFSFIFSFVFTFSLPVFAVFAKILPLAFPLPLGGLRRLRLGVDIP
jgi:hypothetical protein